MTRKSIGGKLDAEALRRIAARQVDRVNQLREARTLAAQGASLDDIAGAIGLTGAEVRALMGTKGQ